MELEQQQQQRQQRQEEEEEEEGLQPPEEASRTTALPGPSTTDSRLLTTASQDRPQDSQAPLSKDSRYAGVHSIQGTLFRGWFC